MTATERIYSGSKDEILSMDDPSVYGKKTVSRTFKEILNLGSESPIIDYEILTLEISKDEILNIWNDNPYITYDPNDPNAEEELRNRKELG